MKMEDIMKYHTIASMMSVEVRGRHIDVFFAVCRRWSSIADGTRFETYWQDRIYWQAHQNICLPVHKEHRLYWQAMCFVYWHGTRFETYWQDRIYWQVNQNISLPVKMNVRYFKIGCQTFQKWMSHYKNGCQTFHKWMSDILDVTFQKWMSDISKMDVTFQKWMSDISKMDVRQKWMSDIQKWMSNISKMDVRMSNNLQNECQTPKKKKGVIYTGENKKQ
jgi:hypothetical protein